MDVKNTAGPGFGQLLGALLLSLLLPGSAQAAQPVIFDNDMAIDDWATLLFLEKHPAVETIAITIAGSGESHCEPGVRNALALLQLAGRRDPVPVACGDATPLDGYFVFPEAWQVDSDTLSGVAIPASSQAGSEQHAVEVIHTAIASSTEPVVILATGPLTNIAQWLARYPDDVAGVSRLVIMGGSLDAPGNIIVPGFSDGNPNTEAEWNLYVDPVAADRVFRSGINLEMVGLDVTNKVRVTAEFASDFKARATDPAAKFWDQILDKNDWFIASNEYYFWDVLAALVVVEPQTLCRGKRFSLGVKHQCSDDIWAASSDLSMPPLTPEGNPRCHLDAATAGEVHRVEGASSVMVCQATDASRAFEIFTATLTGTAPQ
ncbi:MAG: nucleoside hydrolase [Halieaceae bacterium]